MQEWLKPEPKPQCYSGADPDTCKAIINVTSKIQLGCETVALVLDVFQIGRAFMATRALSGAAEKVLDSGFGEELAERMAGAGEAEIDALAEEFGRQVCENFSKQFESLDREMVELGEMEEESAEFSRTAEKKYDTKGGKKLYERGGESHGERSGKRSPGKMCARRGKISVKKYS
ncbi:pathogenicity island 2 effector protein SseC [Salmonella enterica subsp. arizonae]|uniref:Pathogenicity island 2 effector protein SseC n=1 Tax=Salmonella enterica subsp. arizonae TaxID=59203 RepID=A0A379TCU7_SALER|nr:pathogenicity island 2 effector protein SseC [Salmonella enterica subsp. arizonae]